MWRKFKNSTIWKEFKEFAVKGNVIDLAVGVVIGSAFSKIVNSFVNDIIMPIVGSLTANIDFSNLFISLDGKSYQDMATAEAANAPILKYGLFLTNVLDFLIIAFSIFVVIRQLNKFKKKKPEPEPEPTTKTCPYCQSIISIKAVRCPHCTSHLEEEN